MLGRKDYTPEELAAAEKAVAEQLAAYHRLVEAVDTSDPEVRAALEAFEPLFADTMTLALDRRFVHRIRAVSGKDGNPLNEVELMTESLLDHDGVLTANKVIKLKPDESVLGIPPGERIRLTAADFERLAEAFLAEVRAKFVSSG